MFFYVILIYGVHVHDMKLNHAVGCLRIWTQQINKMYYMLPSMYLQNHPGLMFIDTKLRWFHCHGVVAFIPQAVPDSKIHGANIGPTWGRQDPGGPNVGPTNLAIKGATYRRFNHHLLDLHWSLFTSCVQIHAHLPAPFLMYSSSLYMTYVRHVGHMFVI